MNSIFGKLEAASEMFISKNKIALKLKLLFDEVKSHWFTQ